MEVGSRSMEWIVEVSNGTYALDVLLGNDATENLSLRHRGCRCDFADRCKLYIYSSFHCIEEDSCRALYGSGRPYALIPVTCVFKVNWKIAETLAVNSCTFKSGHLSLSRLVNRPAECQLVYHRGLRVEYGYAYLR